jgi:hypothetical protein
VLFASEQETNKRRYEHQGESGKFRGIKVCKISSQASVTSDIEPNQTRINNDVSDDIMDDTNKISSEGLAKNHAKNDTSDDTLPTLQNNI